jgi:hypothetical protein
MNMKPMAGTPTRRMTSARTSYESSSCGRGAPAAIQAAGLPKGLKSIAPRSGLPQRQRAHTGPVGGAPSRRLQAVGLREVLKYLLIAEAICA